MENLRYDPAIAANVISIIAMIVATMSYRITKKAEASKREAQLPDVTAGIYPIKEQPGWHHVYLTMRNNFQTDLYGKRVTFDRPRDATGLNSNDATEDDRSGNRSLLVPLPTTKAKRSVEIWAHMAAAGTARHPHGIHPGDKAYVSIYVFLPTFTSHLTFSVEFSLRETDIRRRDRHVSRQKVSVPAKQTI